MAEIIQPQKGGRRKTHQTSVDLTPMVDLGFLLISFFMFTTTMAKPKTMEVRVPSTEDSRRPTVFAEEATVTIIPVSDHKMKYYYGQLEVGVPMADVTQKDLRGLLLQKQQQVAALPASFSADAHKLHVLIKPNDNSSYADVVNVLDEMNILDVPYYALVDLSAEEKTAILR